MLRFGHYLLIFAVLNSFFIICVPCVRYPARSRAQCPEGECVLITSCPSSIHSIRTGNHPKFCGWAAQVPLICCVPDTPTQEPIDVPGIPTEEPTDVPDTLTEEPIDVPDRTMEEPTDVPDTLIEEPIDMVEKSGRFSGISPQGCGVRILPEGESTNPRLPLGAKFAVGGVSTIHKWPWMVAIYNQNKKKQLCGGTLIDERHVLTAAHCFAGRSLNPKLYSVQVGEIQINEYVPHQEIEELKTHKGYRPRFDYDDIAIMRLSKPLPSDFVPACVPVYDDMAEGDNVTILGWGDLSFGGPSSSILQEVKDIPIVGNKKCDEKFQAIAKARFPRGIWERFLCAGLEKGGKDACQGDSGGPLLSQNSRGIWYLVGIVSFGYKCGEPGFPGVYTKVSAYASWIANNMGKENEVSMEMRRAKDFDYIDETPVWPSAKEKIMFPMY